MDEFVIKLPPVGAPRLPILLSCPHVGTEIPAEVRPSMDPEIARTTPDVDWFVHRLYEFAPRLGVTLIHARYSRLVVDLNRDPAGKKLYADGRKETGLCPVRTFALQDVYLSGKEPDDAEIARRVAKYYTPYHARVRSLLEEIRAGHGAALLFEAHSIRRRVPSIRPEPFEDLILGDQQGKTAAPILTEVALRSLGEGTGFTLSHNTPFMGGYLTRSFGDPESAIHALQLEMAQDVYMDEERIELDEVKLQRIRPVLDRALRALGAAVAGLAR